MLKIEQSSFLLTNINLKKEPIVFSISQKHIFDNIQLRELQECLSLLKCCIKYTES